MPHRSKSSSIGDEDEEDEDEDEAHGAGLMAQGKRNGTSGTRVVGRNSGNGRNGFGLISVTPCLQELQGQGVIGSDQAVVRGSDGQTAVRLTFSYAWTSGASSSSPRLGSVSEVKWSALLFGGTLYLKVPEGLAIERSKEAFVNLLEFAEEELDCSQILICISKSRPERREYTHFSCVLFISPSPSKCPDYLCGCLFSAVSGRPLIHLFVGVSERPSRG